MAGPLPALGLVAVAGRNPYHIEIAMEGFDEETYARCRFNGLLLNPFRL
jgi:hypothetical protein